MMETSIESLDGSFFHPISRIRRENPIASANIPPCPTLPQVLVIVPWLSGQVPTADDALVTACRRVPDIGSGDRTGIYDRYVDRAVGYYQE